MKGQEENLQLLMNWVKAAGETVNGVNQLSSSWLWLAGNEKENPCWQSGSILPTPVFFAFISDRRSTSISGVELSREPESPSLPCDCSFHLDPPRNCQVNLSVLLCYFHFVFSISKLFCIHYKNIHIEHLPLNCFYKHTSKFHLF